MSKGTAMLLLMMRQIVITVGFSLATSTLATALWADSNCHSLAKTPLEKSYCQIAATPEARNLPSFADFRRNNPQVQAMLLKSPARRLGITLPAVAQHQPPAPSPPAPEPRVKPPAPVSPPSPQAARTRKESEKKATVNAASNVTSSKPTPVNRLAACQFSGTQIRCAEQIFQLVNNRQNNQLAAGALTADNVLMLKPYVGKLSDEVAVNNYLADSYEHYIYKMLLIGLGGSTMTYTKFHYTFWELVDKHEDFAGRVGEMYNFLKQDKANMAVQARYDKQLPGGIDWCQQLNSTIVVCDNGKKNWVYTSTVD